MFLRISDLCIVAQLFVAAEVAAAVAAQDGGNAPLAAAAGACASVAPGRARKVRFWVGYSGSGGAQVIDRATNASCSDDFLSNLTRFRDSIDSLSFEAVTLESNASGPALRLDGGSMFDPGLAACAKQIQQRFNISVGLCSSTTAGNLNVAAANPPKYLAEVQGFLSRVGFHVDELWTDFEVKNIGSGTTHGANEMHRLMQGIRPTFRYAGCEPRDAPYLSENCSAFVAGAPGVTVQAANTYWSTQISSGFYKGFGNLLNQEIENIGGHININALSPAICPDCPSGGEKDNTLTQKQLYERMDLVCAAGIVDFSVFTFFELAQLNKDPQFGRTLAERYFDALYYFRTGKKRLW